MACETKNRRLRNIIFDILKMYPVFNIKTSLYYNYIIGNAKELNEWEKYIKLFESMFSTFQHTDLCTQMRSYFSCIS